MKIEKIPILSLNPAAYNPRKDLQPGDPEYEKLKHSIQAFGCVQTIVWNERTGNVVGGHQTLKILKEQGIQEVDCAVVDLDEPREKALNLALNKITGAWEKDKLFEVLRALEDEANFDLAITGFDEDELNQMLRNTETLNLDDFFADVPDKPEQQDPPKTIRCPNCGFSFEEEES